MKLFIMLSRVPYPIEKGDKLRAFHQIRCLSKHHDIILCALNDTRIHPDAEAELRKYCLELHIFPIGYAGMIWNTLKVAFTGKPFQTGYFYRCSVKQKIHKLIEEHKPDLIFCQLVRVAEYVRTLPGIKTLDYQDVLSMGMKRRIVSSVWWLKPLLKLEYKRLLRYENAIFDDFTYKTIISAPDRDLIPHHQRNEIMVIPNGVDHYYFSPIDAQKKYDLVFTGNMGYAPNVNAAEFLVNEILPHVRKVYPDLTLLIAGANPHPKVLNFASESVTISGWVPDIRESYASSRVFIAPMLIGTGLQNKLLEAMSMKIPCITSPLANSALGAAEGEEILVGRNAEEYAANIISLIKNPDLATSLAAKGYEFVNRTYDWEKSTELLMQLMTGKTDHFRN